MSTTADPLQTGRQGLAGFRQAVPPAMAPTLPQSSGSMAQALLAVCHTRCGRQGIDALRMHVEPHHRTASPGLSLQGIALAVCWVLAGAAAALAAPGEEDAASAAAVPAKTQHTASAIPCRLKPGEAVR